MKSNKLKAIVWTIIIIWAIAFFIFMISNYTLFVLKLIVIIVVIATIGGIYQASLNFFNDIDDDNRRIDIMRKADAELKKIAKQSMLTYKGTEPINPHESKISKI